MLRVGKMAYDQNAVFVMSQKYPFKQKVATNKYQDAHKPSTIIHHSAENYIPLTFDLRVS